MNARLLKRILLLSIALAVSACGRFGFAFHELDAGEAIDATQATDGGADLSVPDMNVTVDLGVDMEVQDDAALDMDFEDAGFDMDVEDAGVDMDFEDAGVDMEVEDAGMPLPEDCTHQWLGSTDIWSNFHMFAGPEGVIVAGITGAGVARTECLNNGDGSVVWSAPNEGAIGGVNGTGYGENDTDVWLMNGLGPGLNMHSLNMSTGASGPYVDYNFMVWGLGNSSSIGLRAGGEALVQLSVTPTMPGTGTPLPNWMASFQGSSTFTEPGPGHIFVLHDATGAYVRHLNVPGAPVYLAPKPMALADGNWSIVLNGGAAGATIDTHSIAAGATELVTIDSSLSFLTAIALPAGTESGTSTTPAGTSIRIVNDGSTSTTLRAYDDSGLLWNRDDCAGYYTESDANYVHIVKVFSGTTTYCGERLGPTTSGLGIAYARIDVHTGATAAVQWFESPRALQGFAVAPDGTAYVAMIRDTVSSTTVCGETVAADGTSGFLIYALAPF